jgi:hypothetical protein
LTTLSFLLAGHVPGDCLHYQRVNIFSRNTAALKPRSLRVLKDFKGGKYKIISFNASGRVVRWQVCG